MDNPQPGTSRPQKPRLKLTRKRKWLFRGLALLGSLVVIEGISWLALKQLGQGDLRLEVLHERQHALAKGIGVSEASNEVIHPYLGWVHNPQTTPEEMVLGKTVSVDSLGFHNNKTPLPKRSSGKFIVGILGGSVAWHTGIVGSPIIRALLESDPLLEGKTVEVVLLAKSSYKQPQQLLTYNYVTVLGAEFDAVVNIDGYNEVVLTVANNFDNKTAIAYPSAWHVRAIQLADPSTSEDALRLVELRAHRQTMARRMDRSFFKSSHTANLLWFLRDRRARFQLQQFGLKAIEKHDGSFIYHGPANSFASDDELHRGVVDLWFRSSLQLHAGCISSGTTYLHVLQPNQYHVGSKPLGPEEQKVAIRSPGISGEPMREIYPLLVKAGQDLARRGVHFSDQTMLFADVEEPIYIDPCCHYNEKGNEMLAQQVALELLKALRQQKDQRND